MALNIEEVSGKIKRQIWQWWVLGGTTSKPTNAAPSVIIEGEDYDLKASINAELSHRGTRSSYWEVSCVSFVCFSMMRRCGFRHELLTEGESNLKIHHGITSISIRRQAKAGAVSIHIQPHGTQV
jgi:hypothetical protein